MAGIREKPTTRVLPLWKLKDLLERGRINLDAPYQREVVWTKTKMCALIDSIMNNYYIPPVLFAVRKAADGRVVRVCIDGKQRLTSILRFMHNEIPYTEFINGQSVDKYYHSDTDDGREYLDERTRDEFDHCEVVVAEFCNLDTDSEIEIFSRVQLGTPLTSAEKLKAHSSPIARYCSDVYDQYRADLSKLFADVRSHIFRYVSQLVLLICNESDKYQGSVLKLEKFLSDNDLNPSPELKRHVAHALNTIAQLISEAPAIFTHLDGEKNAYRPMEFLMFGYYLSKCRRRRSIKEHEEDCVGLRKHMHASPTGIRMGNPCYQVALEWIDERMDATGQTPALIRNPGAASSTDTDEAPEEDENAVEDALAFYKKSAKRPLDAECLEASSSRHRSRPVARRGGKAPRARH